MQDRKGKKFNIKFLVFPLLIAVFFIMVKCCRSHIIIPEVLGKIEQVGVWAPVFYIIVYILISGVIIPSIIVKIFAGTLFGVMWGIIFVSIASTISSLLKFLLARYLFRESILRRVEKSKTLKAIDSVIERDGWKMLIILRNIPVINSMVLNYICGLTKMKVRNFVFASFIGRLPTTVMYVYVGYMVRYAYTIGLETVNERHLILERIILFVGLAAIGGASFYLVRLSRKVLAEKAPIIDTSHLEE